MAVTSPSLASWARSSRSHQGGSLSFHTACCTRGSYRRTSSSPARRSPRCAARTSRLVVARSRGAKPRGAAMTGHGENADRDFFVGLPSQRRERLKRVAAHDIVTTENHHAVFSLIEPNRLVRSLTCFGRPADCPANTTTGDSSLATRSRARRYRGRTSDLDLDGIRSPAGREHEPVRSVRQDRRYVPILRSATAIRVVIGKR